MSLEKDCRYCLTFQHPEPKSSSESTVSGKSSEYGDALVCIVIGSWQSNVIGSEDGEW